MQRYTKIHCMPFYVKQLLIELRFWGLIYRGCSYESVHGICLYWERASVHSELALVKKALINTDVIWFTQWFTYNLLLTLDSTCGLYFLSLNTSKLQCICWKSFEYSLCVDTKGFNKGLLSLVTCHFNCLNCIQDYITPSLKYNSVSVMFVLNNRVN